MNDDDLMTEKKLMFSGHYKLQPQGKFSLSIILPKNQLGDYKKGDVVFVEVFRALREKKRVNR